MSLYCYNNTVTFFRLVGQVVKTPPSQGGIRGSIPLRAAYRETSIWLSGRSFLFVAGVSLAGGSLTERSLAERSF